MALVVVVTSAVVCEVLFVVHGWCTRGGQVSEARLESTFLADDAACLTLVRAVIQLRCFGIVSLGCGLLSCVVCGVSSMEYGFRQSFIPLVSSPSPSSATARNPLQALSELNSTSMRLGTPPHGLALWASTASKATRATKAGRQPCTPHPMAGMASELHSSSAHSASTERYVARKSSSESRSKPYLPRPTRVVV